jgi:hypothetical protein
MDNSLIPVDEDHGVWDGEFFMFQDRTFEGKVMFRTATMIAWQRNRCWSDISMSHE